MTTDTNMSIMEKTLWLAHINRPAAVEDLPPDLQPRWLAAIAYFNERHAAWQTVPEQSYWRARNAADAALTAGEITRDEHATRTGTIHARYEQDHQAVATRTAEFPSFKGAVEGPAYHQAAKEAALAAARAVWLTALEDLEARVTREEAKRAQTRAAAGHTTQEPDQPEHSAPRERVTARPRRRTA